MIFSWTVRRMAGNEGCWQSSIRPRAIRIVWQLTGTITSRSSSISDDLGAVFHDLLTKDVEFVTEPEYKVTERLNSESSLHEIPKVIASSSLNGMGLYSAGSRTSIRKHRVKTSAQIDQENQSHVIPVPSWKNVPYANPLRAKFGAASGTRRPQVPESRPSKGNRRLREFLDKR